MEKNFVYEKIKRRRAIRKYLQKAVPEEVLLKCVDVARLSPSGANMQSLSYVIVNNQNMLKPVFNTLSLVGYLPDYRPKEEEMPKAYIVILVDNKIARTPNHDAGIAAMNISMVAYDEGLGSCILASVDRKKLGELLNVPEGLAIALVVALGYPAENPVVEPVADGDIKYWLDENGVLHVPKRDIKDIVRWNNCQNL